MLEPGEKFARELRGAEDRLRATGLSGRNAFLALVRSLSARLGIPDRLWPEGPDADPVAGLDQIPLTADLDLFGLAYERFFADLFKGQKGQYFTPRPLVELMADLAEVGPRDRVLDPTCGSGGFLLAALDRGADIDGIDVDSDLVSLARLNLALHGANPRAVRQGNFFLEEEGTWSVILANPPFSVSIRDPKILERFSLGREREQVNSDRLFLEAAWKCLSPNGRLCTVLPYSVLVNASAKEDRKWLEERFVRRAVIGLPEGTFRPFGGTSTRACVLLLQKRPARVDKQLVAEVRSPGFDPRRKDYRRCEPDELATLRLFLRGVDWKGALWVEPGGPWAPTRHLEQSSMAAGVPVVRFGSLAQMALRRVDPSARPEESFCEVDLADLDKSTGEVSRARKRRGSDFKEGQGKVLFSEGDLLFGRMRPGLNNVGVASRPDDALPEQMLGSGEWVPFRPTREPYFALLALRSSFVREQLQTTGGQTRPRAKVEDLPRLRVPDPGPQARARLDEALAEVHRERLRWKKRLLVLERLYKEFGEGIRTQPELLEALDALDQ